MSKPLVTVIVPAFNAEDLIGDAIESVLAQTYPHFELLVADDRSTDRTRDVVRRCADPRVQLLEHAVNRGPDFARVTALHASKGDIIAFLDQDDVFLPGKLATHVDFLAAHPDVGFTYNPFFVRTCPGDRVQFISRPPDPLTLADLVLGFPLPPSTWVMRRPWALREELWDEDTMFRGREVVFCGRLFMAGCRFALVDTVLSHRRVHLDRRFDNPASKCRAERRCQAIMLDDPRCPDDVRDVRGQAEANAWQVWARVALAQNETICGRELLHQAFRLNPHLAEGEPNALAEFFLHHAVTEASDAEAQLRQTFAQLAPELPWLAVQLEWTVVQAHLILGTRHVMWGRPAEAEPHWARVKALGGTPDDIFLQRACYEILSVEQTLDARRAHEMLAELGGALTAVGGRGIAGRLGGSYRMMRAFDAYGRGSRRSVPVDVLHGMLAAPREMRNLGAWSILVRSALTPEPHPSRKPS